MPACLCQGSDEPRFMIQIERQQAVRPKVRGHLFQDGRISFLVMRAETREETCDKVEIPFNALHDSCVLDEKSCRQSSADSTRDDDTPWRAIEAESLNAASRKVKRVPSRAASDIQHAPDVRCL